MLKREPKVSPRSYPADMLKAFVRQRTCLTPTEYRHMDMRPCQQRSLTCIYVADEGL